MIKREVNYRNKKRYKTAKYPIRQPRFFTWLIWVLSKIMLIGKKKKIEKINMEGLKGPYLMFSNHMHFIDFELTAVALYPARMNNVVNIDGFYKRAWLLNWIGAIATRKFTTDLHLIKSMMKCLKRNDSVGLYPEARYGASGTTSFLPTSLGKLVKKCKVPVVTVIHHGNHLYAPFWNFRDKRKVPLYTRITQLLTVEQIEKMTVEEINETIRKEFIYDDYQYQKDNNIIIKNKTRAEGLHRILYQCPHCHKEFSMNSKLDEIYCEECGKRWKLTETGYLVGNDGVTEFDHIPNWYKWQIENVKLQVENGTYNYIDEVDVFSLPRCKKFYKLGKAKISHSIDKGFILDGHYRKADYKIIRSPLESDSLHVEYDYYRIRRDDCFVINIEDDCYFCYPKNKRVVTKLAIATEEIYKYNLNNRK